ncbi:MAG: M67 family peptidase [Methanomassiliicoccales archaeon]|nr:MAG: M67 family peptidase [Methanomassiliicoccales archaeon]
MVKHSQVESPREACGILVGRAKDNEVRVSRVCACRNVHSDPTVEYLVNPEDQVRIFEEIDEDNEVELLGFYHSHPGGPNGPSQIDSSRNYWPEHLIAIVSLSPEPNVSFWKWENGRFRRQEIVRERF